MPINVSYFMNVLVDKPEDNDPPIDYVPIIQYGFDNAEPLWIPRKGDFVRIRDPDAHDAKGHIAGHGEAAKGYVEDVVTVVYGGPLNRTHIEVYLDPSDDVERLALRSRVQRWKEDQHRRKELVRYKAQREAEDETKEGNKEP